MTNCDPRIEAYMEAVETGKVEASKDVKALMKHVRKCFETEDIYVDQQQLTDYLGLARYFPYDEVFPWQQFVIGLHDCTYWRENGRPRWPDLFCLIGRGAGKDGTIALESTALASEYNGIREYDVDICANNEDQALRPVKDIVGAFEQPKWLKKLQRFFKWTREEVVCKDTRSTIKGHTNNPGGKDGLRSGMVVLKLYWNGTYIKSKSITTAALAADSVTAEKIKVDDLYSLKASIAGFKISSDTISHQSITNPESGIGQNYYDTFFSSKDKRLTFRKGPGTSDYITFDIRGLRASGGKRLNLISDAETNDSSEGFSSGAHHSMGHTNIYGNLYVADSFRTAGTKQAVRQTDNYGEKGVYCYETPTPHFGDIGSGEISEDGKCYIDIEDILKEMINTEMQYYVFLQKCGEGDLYVSECFPDYFIVTGTPGLRFFWELKAKQKGYEYNRYEGEDRVVGFRKIAYDEEYIAETEKLIEEREEI